MSKSSWYPPPSRPRPVQGGVKARSARGAIARTWWSRRFVAVLEGIGLGSRLQRGRSYARRGQVISFEVEPGSVNAQVQGSRVRPYRVRIGIPAFGKSEWARVEGALAENAWYTAKLLAGEMPAVPRLFFGVVDVRDVVALHIAAMTSPDAAGERVLAAAGEPYGLPAMAQLLHDRLGREGRKVPTRVMPDWLVRLGASLRPELRAAAPQVGKTKQFTNAKARRVLGWQPRDNEEAVLASQDGQQIEVDLERGEIRNLTTGQTFQSEPLDPFVARIVQAGGILEYIRQEGTLR